MRMTLSMEGMDMDMETASSVWSIPDLLEINLVQMQVVVEVEVEEDQEEGLDLQLGDLNFAS